MSVEQQRRDIAADLFIARVKLQRALHEQKNNVGSSSAVVRAQDRVNILERQLRALPA